MQETFGLVRSGLDRGSTGVNESEVPKPEHKPIKPPKSQSEPKYITECPPMQKESMFFLYCHADGRTGRMLDIPRNGDDRFSKSNQTPTVTKRQ